MSFCRSSSSRHVLELPHGAVWSCQHCGSLRRHPTSPPREAERYYRHTYGHTFLSQAETPARESMFRSLLDRLGPPRGRRLLDIGAGSGLFVHVAREAGWQADGTELSEINRAWAASRHDVNLRDPEASSSPSASYDVVTLINVLDQAPDPVALLQEARRALRPGGRLLVRVPNATFHIRWSRVTLRLGLKSLARRAVIHPYPLNPKALRFVLGAQEFRVVVLRNAMLARKPRLDRLPRPLAAVFRLAFNVGAALLGAMGSHALWAPSFEAVAELPTDKSSAPVVDEQP